MKINFFIYLSISIILSACNAYISENDIVDTDSFHPTDQISLINRNKLAIYSKFKTPENYIRVKAADNFGIYLNNLPLKADKFKVKLYDGTTKINKNSYVGVIDLPSPSTNIQFHGNAIFRLRAEYLYKNKLYDKINFKVNNRTTTLSYLEFCKNDFSYKKFTEYLDYFLSKTTPNSLIHHLSAIKIKEIKIGDVFIQRSNTKSHAVIVMDLATDNNGKLLMLLGQSYYPGQDLQIISNPWAEEISPWYEATEGVILTPEWRFMSSDLMRFID